MIQTNGIDTGKVPFEEAINRTGFGLYSYILTCLMGLSIISLACIVYASTIIVPSSACELNTTGTQQGLLAAVPMIGTIIGAVMWGFLADRYGRRRMLLVSLLSGAAVNALASLSVNWIMLMILQFGASVLASGQYTIAMTMISESVPMAKRNVVLLLVTSIFVMSQGIMSALAIPIVPLAFSYHLSGLDIYWNSWRLLMIVYSLPGLLCAIFMFFMKESPKYILAKGDEAATLEILRFMHRMNNGKSTEELQIKGIIPEADTQKNESTQNPLVLLFKVPLVKFTAIMATLSVFHQIAAFGIWLPTIADKYVSLLETGEGGDMTLCGIINADLDIIEEPDVNPCALNITALLIVLAVGALQSVFNLLISLVVNRTGRRNMAMAITAFCGVCGILVNLVPNAIGSLVLFITFLMGMLLLGLYTAITVALFPTHLRALAVAFTMTGGRIGGFASIQILNFLLVNNCEVGFYTYASIFASSALVASFLPDDRLLQKQMQKKTAEETQTDNFDTAL